MNIGRQIAEHDVVVFTRDFPEKGFSAGDTAVVIDIRRAADGILKGYMVEVFAADGSTVDVFGVEPSAVRLPLAREIQHVRLIAAE